MGGWVGGQWVGGWVGGRLPSKAAIERAQCTLPSKTDGARSGDGATHPKVLCKKYWPAGYGSEPGSTGVIVPILRR